LWACAGEASAAEARKRPGKEGVHGNAALDGPDGHEEQIDETASNNVKGIFGDHKVGRARRTSRGDRERSVVAADALHAGPATSTGTGDITK
jgi:hypothetical protein